MQPQLLDQFQRQPRAAELPAVLDPHTRAVDLDEPRLGLGLRKQLLLRRWRLRVGRLLHAQPARLVHQPQIGHRPLPRASFGAVRLDQRPIRFALAVAPTEVGSQEHAAMLATIPRTFFHYTPSARKYLDQPAPHRHRDTTYVKTKFRKNRRPRDFVETLGKLG